MDKNEGAAAYSIAAVSKLSGIGCHALRVWERRYGFPLPLRSPSGHRRYPADQVKTLVEVARRLHDGASLGALMALIRAGTLEVGEAIDPGPADPVALECAAVLDRLQCGALAAADAEYLRIVEGMTPHDCVRLVLQPGLVEVGERWFRGEIQVYQEHCATSFLRRKLLIMLEEAQAANVAPSHTAIVGTVQGDRHEGGVLMLSILLELAGWRAQVLGVDVPVREVQKAVESWTPDAVCLSFILSRNINKRFAELARIRDVPVFVGGRSILNYQRLARRHGLHPLVGPGEETIGRLIAQVDGNGA